MQNAGGVRRGQAVRDAHEQLDDLPPRPLFGSGPSAKRASVDKFGDQVLAPIELACVVDGQNMRMIERRGHLRFALEAAAGRGIGPFVGEELYRDRPIELRISRLIHLAHAAGPKPRENLVSADLSARE